MKAQRRTLANIVGCVSVACSSSFWVEVCVTKLLGYTPRWFDLGINGWILGWVVGFVLAFVAASFGQRRWAIAAALPFVSFLSVIAAMMIWPVQW